MDYRTWRPPRLEVVGLRPPRSATQPPALPYPSQAHLPSSASGSRQAKSMETRRRSREWQEGTREDSESGCRVRTSPHSGKQPHPLPGPLLWGAKEGRARQQREERQQGPGKRAGPGGQEGSPRLGSHTHGLGGDDHIPAPCAQGLGETRAGSGPEQAMTLLFS